MLSHQIYRYRRHRLLSQTELGELVGVSRHTIAILESGGGRVSVALQVIEALGLRLGGLPTAPQLGQRVVLRRKQRGLSQRALAERAGVSHPVVVRLETRSDALVANLERIAAALASTIRLKPKFKQWFERGLPSDSGNHNTPADLMAVIHLAVGEFDLDPCSHPDSHVRAKLHYFEDGLAQPWVGTVWANPPFGDLRAWVVRADQAVASGEARLVLALLPVRMSNAYYHKHVLTNRSRIWFLKRRLGFGQHKSLSPFQSMLVLWGGSQRLGQRIDRALKSAGFTGA